MKTMCECPWINLHHLSGASNLNREPQTSLFPGCCNTSWVMVEGRGLGNAISGQKTWFLGHGMCWIYFNLLWVERTLWKLITDQNSSAFGPVDKLYALCIMLNNSCGFEVHFSLSLNAVVPKIVVSFRVTSPGLMLLNGQMRSLGSHQMMKNKVTYV